MPYNRRFKDKLPAWRHVEATRVLFPQDKFVIKCIKRASVPIHFDLYECFMSIPALCAARLPLLTAADCERL